MPVWQTLSLHRFHLVPTRGCTCHAQDLSNVEFEAVHGESGARWRHLAQGGLPAVVGGHHEQVV